MVTGWDGLDGLFLGRLYIESHWFDHWIGWFLCQRKSEGTAPEAPQ